MGNTRLTLLALGALIAQALGTNHYIRESSTSLLLDMVLLTGLTLSLMGVSFIVSRALAGVLEQRKRDELKARGLEELGDAFTADSGSSVMRNSLLFVATLCVLSFVVDGPLLGNLSDYYGREGRLHTTVRAGNTDQTSRMLLEISTETLGPDLHYYTETFMIPLLDNHAVRGAALNALWVTGERMGRSVDLIVFTGAESGGWEKDLMVFLKREAAEKVRKIIDEDQNTEIRSEAYLALGSFRTKSDLPVLQAGLESGSEANISASIEGLWAHKGDLDAARILVSVLETKWESLTPEARRLAIFGVGEVMTLWQPSRLEQKVNDEASQLISRFSRAVRGGDFEEQCTGITAIRKTRIPSSTKVLFELFEQGTSGMDCPLLSHERAPLSPLTLAVHGEYQFRILDALSLMALGNPEIRAWLIEQEGRAEANPEVFSKAVKDALKSLAIKLKEKG